MIELSRTVRVCITEGEAAAPEAGADASVNGFGGIPAMCGVGRFYEIHVGCAGVPDARTGYLINIKEIDHAVREHAMPILQAACAHSTGTRPDRLMPAMLDAVSASLHGLITRLRLSLTPTHSLEIDVNTPNRVTIRQRFDFAAAHRLHVPELSDEENRALFGKCNNPNGHGHNYRIEPSIVVRPDADRPFTLDMLERVTDETIIERFDHKHLNLDTQEFGAQGVNPSVENIARVSYELLSPRIAEASSGGASLASIKIGRAHV